MTTPTKPSRQDSSETNVSSSLPALLAALASGARAVHDVPLGEDFSFESSFPEFSKLLGETQESLLQVLTSGLQQLEAGDDNNDDSSLHHLDDPLLWDRCADTCDALLDQVEGYLKSNAQIDTNTVTSLTQLSGMARQRAQSTMGRLVDATVDMEKPQSTYEIDASDLNHRTEPFVPQVHPDKPFGVTPLDLSLRDGHGLKDQYGTLRSNVALPRQLVAPSYHVGHVYQTEIESLEFRPWQLNAPKKEDPLPSTQQPIEAQWIDTLPDLQALVDRIESEQVQEVAIDLEHHSYRTFAGLTCLMQLSFRKNTDSGKMQNYLIDVLALWKDINSCLAPMFANPDIVKLMHGADSDVQWLQRDFGIYIVNLFDTGQAARALKLPSASLAYLLQKYAQVQADKTHQLSDWRQRPLPEDMRRYAIMDTHYLLDIYHRLLWDCQQNKETAIVQVLDASKQVCLIRYTKEPFKPQGFQPLLKQRGASGKKRSELNAQQELVLERLWDWRDQLARDTDESTAYVCPNAALLRICLSCPTTVTALQALLNPLPPLVLRNAPSITNIIKKVARDARATPTPTSNIRGVDSAEDEDGSTGLGPSAGAPSSAFFKPADATVDDRMRRSVLSPVLGTEALYKQAGWITPLDQQQQHRAQQKGQSDAATSDEDDPSLLVDEDGKRPKPRHLLAVNSANKDYQTKLQTSHSLGSGKDIRGESTKGESGAGRARIMTADGLGTARAAREHSQSPRPSSSTIEQEAKGAQEDAARIRKYMAQKEDLLGLISARTGEEDDEEDDDGRPKAGVSGGVEAAGGRGGAESGDEDEEEFSKMPRSMRDIYKISNRNRRNKKVSSPTPGPTLPTDENEMEHLAKAEALLAERGGYGKGYFGDRSPSPGVSKRQRTKSNEADSGADGSNFSREDDAAFMREIGWIKSKEAADQLLGQQSSGAGRNTPGDGECDIEDTNSKAGRESKTPTAFDYSSAGPIGAFPPLKGAPAANPFFAGVAVAGGALAQGGSAPSAKGDRKKSGGGKGGKQNRKQQERPEKREGKTHSYRGKR